MSFRTTKQDWTDYYNGMKPHVMRFFRSFKRENWSDISHAFVNIYVESARLDPYIHGHLQAFAAIGLLAGVLVYVIWGLGR